MTARAAVMVAPGQVEIREYPVPVPEEGAMILQPRLSGICGTDVHTFLGETLQYAGTANERHVRYPVICGHENVATVIETGGECRSWDGEVLLPGDRVVPAANLRCGRCWFCATGQQYHLCEHMENYGNSLGAWRPPHLLGGWSEAMYLLPGSAVFKVPAELPDDVAVLTEPVAVTHGIDRALRVLEADWGAGAGASVLVIGAGALGLAHLIKARGSGLGPLNIWDRSAERLKLARRLGADETYLVSPASDAPEDYPAGTRRGVDLVVDCAGSAGTFEAALAAVRPGGVVVEAGAYVGTGAATVNPNSDICARGVTVMGIGGETPENYLPTMRRLVAWQDWIKDAELVSRRIGLEDVQGTLSDLARRDSPGKVVVDPT